MMQKLFRMLALFTVSTISLAPCVNAEGDAGVSWSSPEELRTEYTRLLDTLSERVPASDQSAWAVDLRQKISAIRQQVNDLSDPMLGQMATVTDRQTFTSMVDRLAAGDRPAKGAEVSLLGPQPQAAIVPPDDSGAVAGTTCSTSPTSAGTIDGEKIGLYVDRGLSIVADVACESLVVVLGEGTNIPACIAFGVTKAVEVVLDSLIDHQEFCNGLLDGAKVDAILGDVVNVHDDVGAVDTHLTNVNNQIAGEFAAADTHLTNVNDQITSEFAAVDTHLTNVDNHIAQELLALANQLSAQISEGTKLLDAHLKQVMRLELTPDGLRKIAPAILTCTGANCPNVLANCPAAGCSWNNVGPLP